MNSKMIKTILTKMLMRKIEISTPLSTSLKNQFERHNIGSSLQTKISSMIMTTVMIMEKKMIGEESMRNWLQRWFGIKQRIITSSVKEKKTKSKEIVNRKTVSRGKESSKKKRPELDLIKNNLRKSRQRKSSRNKKTERKRRIRRRRGRSTKKPTRLTKISM